MQQKKVLCLARRMHGSGGIQKYIYNLYSNMDKDSVQMDFIIPDANREGQTYLDMIESKGARTYLIPSHKENLVRHVVNVFKISRKYNKHGIMHLHVSDGFCSIDGIIARIAGIKNIVYHSHNASFIESKGKKVARFLFQMSGTYFFGCTKDAGIYMFGEAIINSGKFMVAKNGIDTNLFKFDEIKRKKIRDEFNISKDTKVLGFVGRISSEKNVCFAIETFNEFLKLESNSKLILIGDGEEINRIRDIVIDYSIQDKVIFTSVRSDVNYIMSALDVLLLPSKYESLGIVLIEAQASGLPCLVSQGVTKDAKITDLLYYLKLDSNKWAKKIYDIHINKDRTNYYKEVKNVGYDIEDTAREMQNFYMKTLN